MTLLGGLLAALLKNPPRERAAILEKGCLSPLRPGAALEREGKMLRGLFSPRSEAPLLPPARRQ